MPLGPGYTIMKQDVDVRFVPAPEPRIELIADYQLRNTGNQPLESLELRLPRENLLRLAPVSITWDAQAVPFDRRSDPAGDILRIPLSAAWPVKQMHALHVQYGIGQGGPQKPQLDFPAGSFYLPPGAWLVALLTPKGTFAGGGVPPKEWTLALSLPAGFVVHAPGSVKRNGTKNGEARFEFQQRTPGLLPFVVAGRYHQHEYRGSPCAVILWKKTPIDPEEAEPLFREVQQTAKVLDTLFGPRGKHARPVWIVDRPIPAKPFHDVSSRRVSDDVILAQPPPDFGFINLAESGERIWNQETTRRETLESIAKAWLGYGLGSGFDEQPYPTAALPAYAVSLADESIQGPQARRKIIVGNLKEYDSAKAFLLENARDKKDSSEFSKRLDNAHPGRSVLFFYALEDQYGREHLHAALRHMVQARRGQSYGVQDLLAALEQETRQDVGAFFRLWLKHPGIPEEFRARYESAAAPQNAPEEKQK